MFGTKSFGALKSEKSVKSIVEAKWIEYKAFSYSFSFSCLSRNLSLDDRKLLERESEVEEEGKLKNFFLALFLSFSLAQ